MQSVRSTLVRLCGAAAFAVAAATSAHATTFNFSYQFGDAQLVTGTLDGTLDGTVIDNVSNVSISLDGVAYSGPISLTAYDSATGMFDAGVAAQVSTVAADNNFMFSDGDSATYDGVNNYFYMSSSADLAGAQVYATTFVTGQSALDAAPVSASWSLTAAAVPELPSVALLVAGLGLLGTVARRRRQA